jgi:predicted nucleic acid-binding protein
VLAIDTNVVVRYLTGDDPEQASRARDLVDGTEVFVPVTVLLETAWVLRGAYRQGTADIVRALRDFAGLPGVAVEDPEAVAAALDLAAQGMDFADALRLARSGHCDGFATYDRRLMAAAAKAGIDAVRLP